MAFNGSGTFNLPAGNPVSGVSNSTVHNNTNSEIAAALTNCITRDGQSPATANIPLGGFKITGSAAATANGDLVRYEQAALLAGATFTGLVNLAAGADIASAATINLTAATGNSPRITGTTPTSAVTMNTGQQVLVVADGAWPLTYHATTNKLSTGADYTCTAGDMVLYSKDQSGIVHGTIFSVTSAFASALLSKISVTRGEILYHNGTTWSALAAGTSGKTLTTKGAGADPAWESPSFSSSSENAAGTIENKAVDPLGIREAFNATGTAPVYACRAWVNFNGTGTVAIRGSGNVSSITDNGTGDYTVNFTTAMQDANYAVGMSVDVNTGPVWAIQDAGMAAGSVNVLTSATVGGSSADNSTVCVSVFR